MHVQLGVLVVDNEALILDLLVTALEDGGYEVVQARSGHDALAILDEHAGVFGGVVTDVNLGGGSTGWDVARRARELNPGLPIVYISGNSAHEWRAQGVPRSVLLSKPFALADVVVALASARNTD